MSNFWNSVEESSFPTQLTECCHVLKQWGDKKYKQFGRSIDELKSRLQSLKWKRNDMEAQIFNDSAAQLRRLYDQEEAYWKQRSKQHWLKEGDRNTKFFQQYAIGRRRKNRLSKIQNEDNIWVEGVAMQKVIKDYFTNIFSSSLNSLSGEGEVRTRWITPEQNAMLSQPFTKEEVKQALFSMNPDKSPGPDGINPGFYQSFWNIIGDRLSDFYLGCLNACYFPEGLNDAFITLIPKKHTLEKVADLRPIALCNVSYKIMAKMIANRMKGLLNDVISANQSAFLPNRLITDNILVAAEMGHFLKRKQYGKEGWVALKLDMAKAYDRMEWNYLELMMSRMGFNEGWIRLIMHCVTTVRYKILINGVPSEQIIPTRGLRQGDPLSPYLFILCAEGLSLLLLNAEERGKIHGIRVARGAPTVSHLLFADDSLLFFKANNQEASLIKHCLREYEVASGQTVNYHKSSVTFSGNTQINIREDICRILEVEHKDDLGKYLGLPSFINRNKRAIFEFIEHKIRQRTSGWNKKFLTNAGKEVLIRSVAQSMSVFAMSIYLLPAGTCMDIERSLNRFWWGSRGKDDRRIHWMRWDRLCEPKEQGGLSFKLIREFNLALLGKQAWRFITSPESLVTKIFKARYFANCSFMEAVIGHNPSYC